MNKFWLTIILLVIFFLIAVGWYSSWRNNRQAMGDAGNVEMVGDPVDISQPDVSNGENKTGIDITEEYVMPLVQAGDRMTKKPFGIYIDSATSLVQPERFQGFHTGTDFEILSGEENADVEVMAICPGRILLKEWVSGYGGVVVTSCLVQGEQVIVLYGHLNLDSVGGHEWDEIKTGDVIGKLGDAFSEQTDGERKHLHLGIHRGEAVTLAGYVENESDLLNWIDPCDYICK